MSNSKLNLFFNNYLILVIFIFISIFFWWPTKNLPYHWDSTVFVINSAIKSNLIDEVTKDLPNNFLIVDECHRSGAPNFQRIFKATRKFELGLSATPEREMDDAFEKIIEKELGQIIGTYTYKDALRDDIIPQYNIYNYAKF